jgi:hypothetical protein
MGASTCGCWCVCGGGALEEVRESKTRVTKSSMGDTEGHCVAQGTHWVAHKVHSSVLTSVFSDPGSARSNKEVASRTRVSSPSPSSRSKLFSMVGLESWGRGGQRAGGYGRRHTKVHIQERICARARACNSGCNRYRKYGVWYTQK